MDFLSFKINIELNLKYAGYNQELADLNEMVKGYIMKNFKDSLYEYDTDGYNPH